MKNKRDIFRSQSRTKKTIFIAMVTTHCARENEHYRGLIDGQLAMDALFIP